MKRNAAVIGPTPQFVRWAIEYDCPFRDNDSDRLPVATFQQLRALHAISLAQSEHRCWQGYCFAPATDSRTPTDQIKAIPVDEVLELYGDADYIEAQCGHCPANASPHAAEFKQVASSHVRWAGCYGFLPADLAWSPETSSVNFRIDEALVRDLTEVIDELEDSFKELHPQRSCNWYGVWQTRLFQGPELVLLGQFLQRIARNDTARDPKPSLAPENDRPGDNGLSHILNAANRCIQYDLVLKCELVPAGNSNGDDWTLNRHCHVCRATRSGLGNCCPQCKSTNQPVPEKKCKVLGDRPYLLLEPIVGKEKTVQLVSDYTSHRATQ